MPAIDAYTLKQHLYEDLHTPFWHDFIDTYTASVRGEVDGTIGATGYVETGEHYTRRSLTTLRMSETFYVAPLMNRLVTAAAESWPEDETVEAEDFPTPFGFMWLPGGVTTIDIRGRVLRTSAYTWRVDGSAVHLTCWAHKDHDPMALRTHPGYPNLPLLTPWHEMILHFGRPVPTTLQLGKALPPEVSDQIVWDTSGPNPAMFFPQGWSPEEMVPKSLPSTVTAWLVAALRIMQQPLASVERQGIPANVRKLMLRRKIRLNQKAVTVIDFRKRKGDFQHTGEREYTHRFFRRGHWRRQPYKRDDGEWDRRRIYIHATIVGDPSLPLVLREHVNALTR